MELRTRPDLPTNPDRRASGGWPLLIAAVIVLAFMATASLSLDYCLACL